MSLTIVIDGGGTGCRAAAFDASGNQVAQVASGPANLSRGADQVWSSIASGIASLALELQKPSDWFPDNLWCGLAGSSQTTQKQRLLSKMPSNTNCTIINDGHAQLLGCASNSLPAACLSIGTGSIVNILSENSQHSTIGGWGFPSGDEGGGAWLGMQAIKQYTHWFDQQQPLSKASPLIKQLAAIIEPNVEAIQYYSASTNPKLLGQLAPVVFNAAEEDPIAASIVSKGVASLSALTSQMPANTQLYLAGGLAAPYRSHLETALNTDIPLAQENAALIGLYHLAKAS